jgi:hypothetical protein
LISDLDLVFLNPYEEILLTELCEVKLEFPLDKKSMVGQVGGLTSNLIKDALNRKNDPWELILTTSRLIIKRPKTEAEASVLVENVQSVEIKKPHFRGNETLVIHCANERGLVHTIVTASRLSNNQLWKNKILDLKQFEKKRPAIRWEIIKLLKSQEYTTFDELSALCRCWLSLAYSSIDNKDQTYADRLIMMVISELVANAQVDGFVDKEKRRFIHMTSYKQKSEIVQYNIATSFEFGRDGTIMLRCPNCNSPKSPKEKTSEIKCDACGHMYAVPKKILDMI